MGKFEDYLLSVTSPDTLKTAQQVLLENEVTAISQAIRMGRSGQPCFVVDYLLLALREGAIVEEQGAYILATAIENSLRWEKDLEMVKNLRVCANELREVGYLPPFAPPELTKEQLRELNAFVAEVREKLPHLRALFEPNEGACDMRYWKNGEKINYSGIKGIRPRCGLTGEGECRYPNTDMENCPLRREIEN